MLYGSEIYLKVKKSKKESQTNKEHSKDIIENTTVWENKVTC